MTPQPQAAFVFKLPLPYYVYCKQFEHLSFLQACRLEEELPTSPESAKTPSICILFGVARALRKLWQADLGIGNYAQTSVASSLHYTELAFVSLYIHIFFVSDRRHSLSFH